MAGVISISSDEDVTNEDVISPAKKIKIDPIICLNDDDDEKESRSKNESKDSDIIIDSDEDIFFSEKYDQSNVNSEKSISKSDDEIESSKSDSKNIDVQTKHTDNEIANGSINKSALNKEDAEVHKDFTDMFTDCKEMQTFINVCLSQIDNETTKNLFKSKIPVCRKLFDKVGSEYIESERFKALLEDKITISKQSSVIAISSFNDIYQTLKTKVRIQKRNTGESSTENSPTLTKNEQIIAKLEHALRKIQKVLVRLEEAEVDFDEEEDSNYIKMQRYRERAVKIHQKLCKYTKEDAHVDRITYTRLDFSGSEYPEFNHAINKKFKNNSVFPTYYEVECCLNKTVKNKNMALSDGRIKEEARNCFKVLGNLLQKRRQLDLLNIHSDYLTTNDDPAVKDKELEVKLTANYKEANTKINQLCEKYTQLQESGQDPKVSSDSDDSNRASTEDEND